jgi:hypothetical protein
MKQIKLLVCILLAMVTFLSCGDVTGPDEYAEYRVYSELSVMDFYLGKVTLVNFDGTERFMFVNITECTAYDTIAICCSITNPELYSQNKTPTLYTKVISSMTGDTKTYKLVWDGRVGAIIICFLYQPPIPVPDIITYINLMSLVDGGLAVHPEGDELTAAIKFRGKLHTASLIVKPK